MAAPSLSKQLEDGIITSPFDDKEFVPLDILRATINNESVQTELGLKSNSWANTLGLTKPSLIPAQVTNHAHKIFGALVLMDRTEAIRNLFEEGLSDEHLPLSRDVESEALVSRDGATKFPFTGWRDASVRDFVGHKQWLFQAPILDTIGQSILIDQKCPLPFVKSEVVANGAAGIVHQAELHQAHQRGFQKEAVDFQVAVKEFLHWNDFLKEDEILQQINSLKHPNIIRHFASIGYNTHRKGYIIFPWADGGNLHDFWEAEPETSPGRILWSLEQMLGLARALHLLHERFGCRHGDIKPGNILCVKEGRDTVLKIADFGISRIHHAQTIFRKAATTSNFLTPSYQGPEVEFENVDPGDQQPRSRKYDIWSLGCVFLEFSLWLLHGPKSIEGFASARGRGVSSNDTSRPLYEVTDKSAKAAKVHKLVSLTMENLKGDQRCRGDTALAALLSLIGDKMLQPEIHNRPSAEQVGTQLESIVDAAKKRPSYLSPPCSKDCIPILDFKTLL